jgi:peptidoglycan/xylan/chitin deacetylase (PgdA/CDA1 family)
MLKDRQYILQRRINMNLAPFTREILLTAYRWTTHTARERLVREFAESAGFPAAILFYHRVADVYPNDWSISRDNFLQHLNWVQSHSAFVSLDSIRKTQSESRRSTSMVGLTFDDGYAENWEFAIPTIIERLIPCTYFVSTHFVETGDPFPHDVRAGRPLKPNSIADIRRMAEEGITIGAHTHTHFDFGQSCSDQQLAIEINESRKKLQDWSQQPVDTFAFPFGLPGNISQRAIDAVFDAGFECYVSAAGGLNWPGDSASHLERIHGDPGLAGLANWLTFDPRKVHRPSPFGSQHLPKSASRSKSDL